MSELAVGRIDFANCTPLFLALERALLGWNAFGYHVVALLLHAANGVLAGLLARRCAGRLALPRAGAIGIAAALVFLLHPIGIEVVP